MRKCDVQKITFNYRTLFTFLVLANETFTLKVNGLENGSFSQKHLLSANYGFGCSGQNLSPEIEWKNVPKDTKSFVLTVSPA